MKMLATTTIIRGTGACEVFINDVLNKEIERMNKEHNERVQALANRLQAAEDHRDDLLTDRLAVVRACNAKSAKPFAAFRERAEILWCQLWGIGEALGLWVYEHDD